MARRPKAPAPNTRVYRVAFGSSFVLVRATNDREALSIVRDRVDREFRRKSLKTLGRDDFTCRPAAPHEIALMAGENPRRNDQGVML